MASTSIYVYLYRHLMSMNHYESQKIYFIKHILTKQVTNREQNTQPKKATEAVNQKSKSVQN